MPRLYGKYELIARIATGGMAEVWLARSSSIGGFEKILAIKRMHPKLSENEDLVSLFIEEAKLTVGLNHPNIVQIFDFGRIEDDYFIAMEYVEGVDLAALAERARERGNPIPVDAALFIVAQILEGLDYAHPGVDSAGRPKSGIIHRDISPHNILLSSDGHVKISDFGIAKAAEELTSTGEIVGKIAYMAPEQARGETLKANADLFSVGVILHELLANERLFARTTEPDTLAALASGPIAPPSTKNPEVAPLVDKAALALLSRDPELRPESAAEALDLFSDILRELYPKTKHQRVAEVILEAWDGVLPSSLDASLRPSVRQPVTMESTLQRGAPVADGLDATAKPASEPTLGTPALDDDELRSELDRLEVLFDEAPSLWTLVDMSEAYESAMKRDQAIIAMKLAALKFAQSGLLVQAAALFRTLIDLEPIQEQIASLPQVPRMNEATMLEAFFGDAAHPTLNRLLGLVGWSNPGQSEPPSARAPIFSELDGPQLTSLVQALRLREASKGETIVREGDEGSTFFWVGRGRVLVHATNYSGKRVYLTALAEGDCFGEHAFFTKSSRMATVEAAEAVTLLEVDATALDRLVHEFPSVNQTLRQFYKERVAESVLAKSEMFGRLSGRERRRMAERFGFIEVPSGDLILREGEESNAFYAIKSGEVEVFSGEGDGRVRFATLGPGDIFGEVAALTGRPRNANVSAMTDSELLRLEATELSRFLDQNPEIKEKIEAQIAIREKDRTEKIGA